MSDAQKREALGRTYDDEFYEVLDAQVRTSAEIIVPRLIDLLHPSSVLDVGCGRGTWLSVFRAAGVTDVVGIDGPHIAAADLEIPTDAFIATDLGTAFDVGRRFDLAMSLEVAEHLPDSAAAGFVASIVAHAPVVLFSAAIPFQGGAGHVNERWPSYWAERFAAHGYVPIDAVRAPVWDDERVAFWYAQNTILYADESHAPALDSPAGLAALDVVHPRLHERDHAPRNRRPPPPPSLRRAVRDLGAAARRAVSSRARPSRPSSS